MKIGIFPPLKGETELNKWYWGIEIRKCPPGQVFIFRPWIMLLCVKVTDWGNPELLGGAEKTKKGGWKTWASPIGIEIRIEYYGSKNHFKS